MRNLSLAQGMLPCKFGGDGDGGNADDLDYEDEERATKAKIRSILQGLPELFELHVSSSWRATTINLITKMLDGTL